MCVKEVGEGRVTKFIKIYEGGHFNKKNKHLKGDQLNVTVFFDLFLIY